MLLKSLLQGFSSAPRRPVRRDSRAARLLLESLEDRCVPAMSVINLGPLGGVYVEPTDINASGQIVGHTYTNLSAERAFVWQNGTMTDLGTLGGNMSKAHAINDVGQIVGESNMTAGGAAVHAFLITPEDTNGNGVPDRWFRDANADGKNDLMRDLGAFGGGASQAFDVNNSGQVVGTSVLTGNTRVHAVLWQNDVMTDLGTLGGADSYGNAINDAGQITGHSALASGHGSGFLWQNGTMHPIALSAVDINASGQHVGPSPSAISALWTPTTPNGLTYSSTPLMPLPFQYMNVATSLNDAGQVVGRSIEEISHGEWGSDYIYHAVLWTNGAVQALDALQPANSNWQFSDAAAINNAGQIVGTGKVLNPATGQMEFTGFLMTPESLTLPQISVGDARVTETDSGTILASFTVTLSAASSQSISVNFATGNGTATAGSDYVATTGNVSIAPGQLTATISVPVLGDRTVDFGAETFQVGLSAPSGAILGDAVGIGTIDDNEPRIAANTVTVLEGDDTAVTAIVTISLSNAYDQAITVQYSTFDSGATAGSDYVPVTSSVTFVPGDTSKDVEITILGDRIAELEPYEEYFFDVPEQLGIRLTSIINNAYVGQQGVVIIQDNEPRASFAVDTVFVDEGNDVPSIVVATVNLSNAYNQPVTVEYATSAQDAAAGSDYTHVSGTLLFNPGQLSRTIEIPILGDRIAELGELVQVTLSNASSNAFASSIQYINIRDNEPVVLVNQSTAYVLEGNDGTTPATFSLRLSQIYDEAVTVAYTTSDGSAVAGSDYVATTGTVTFYPGETEPRTFSIPVIGDTAYEPSDSFRVNLSPTVNAFVNLEGMPRYSGMPYASVNIVNDDAFVPDLRINSVETSEGNTGVRTLRFAVTLSQAASQTVTVNWATANDSALAGADYQAASGTLTIPQGQTTGFIDVQVIGDRTPESTEVFFVKLTGATNAIIAAGQGVGVIHNDEPSISISDVSRVEGKRAKKTQFSFTVTLSNAYDQPITVYFRTVDDTARTGDADYVAKTGTLTFSPGQTSKTITIEVNGDSKKESDDTFFVDLFDNSVFTTFTKKRGVGTIVNDD